MPLPDGPDIDGLIARGREAPNLEYKQSMPWDDLNLKLKLVKAALAFANTRDGGYIVIGMEQLADDRYEPQGMTPEHLAGYTLDKVQTEVNRYAAPFVSLDATPHKYGGKTFFVIAVDPFEDVPVICTRDAETRDAEVVLRRAAIYTRSRRMVSSAPIDNPDDMRALIDLATDRAVARLRARGILQSVAPSAPTDEDWFTEQERSIEREREV